MLRLAETVMEPVVITATISFCDEEGGEHRCRVLRVDIPRIAFTVNERQYAIVLAAYDTLVASPMYTRRAATDSEQTKGRRAVDVEIGVEAVSIDLITAFTGEALWKFRCDPIDICHQDDHLLVHLGKMEHRAHLERPGRTENGARLAHRGRRGRHGARISAAGQANVSGAIIVASVRARR